MKNNNDDILFFEESSGFACMHKREREKCDKKSLIWLHKFNNKIVDG